MQKLYIEMKLKKVQALPPIPSVLLAILSVQGGAAIAKGLFPVLGVASVSAFRIVLSALILVAFNRPNLREMTKVQWKTVVAYGACLGAMNVVFYMAIERIPLGLAVTLEFIGPLVLAILGSKRMLDYVWVVLAAGGIALIAPWNTGGPDLLGMALALVAGIFWAGYILIGGRISKLMDGGKAVSIGMIVASLIILPIAIADGLLTRFNLALLVPGIGLALLSSAIPFSLEIRALKHLPAKTFSILMSLEPAVAALCGLIFLKEALSLNEWLAVALVVAASAGATLTRKKTDEPLKTEEAN